MTVHIYRLGSGADGNFAALSESDQTAASRTDGWTVGTTASGNSADFKQGTKQPATALTSQTTTPKPDSFITAAGSDALKTPAALTGVFAATAWTLTFAVRSATGTAQRGRMRLRVFKSANANGSSATELTAATQVGSTLTAISTTADNTTVVSWTPAATITLNNEFLFFVIAWEVTTAGSSSTADLLMRTGQSAAGSRIVTSDLAPPPTTVAIGRIPNDTQLNNVSTSSSTGFGFSGQLQLIQPFIAHGVSIKDITVRVNKVGAPTQDLVVKLYNTSGGYSNQVIGTWTIPNASITTAYKSFTFTANIPVTDGAQYDLWITPNPNPLSNTDYFTADCGAAFYGDQNYSVQYDTGSIGQPNWGLSLASIFNFSAFRTTVRGMTIAKPPPVTDYFTRYDFSDGGSLTIAGGLVNQINDKGSGGFPMTGGTQQPGYGTRTINGINVPVFSGGQYMGNTSPTTQAVQTLFMVALADRVDLTNQVFQSGDGGGVYCLRLDGPQVSVISDYTYEIAVHPNPVTVGQAFLATTVLDNVTARLRVDNVEVSAPYSAGFASSATKTYLGASGQTLNYLYGLIGEVIFFKRVLSATEITAMESYLQQKWGTPIPPSYVPIGKVLALGSYGADPYGATAYGGGYTVYGVTLVSTVVTPIGRRTAATTVRGVTTVGTGTVAFTIGKRAAASTVRGVTMVPSAVAVTIGRRSAGTTVRGVTPAATGTVPITIGRRASSSVVSGLTLVAGGTVPVTVGHRTSASTVRGLGLAAVGAVTITVGKRAASEAVYGVTPAFGVFNLPIGTRAAATTVRGLSLAVSGLISAPVGHRAAASAVNGVTLVPQGAIVTLGHRVAATTAHGVTLAASGTASTSVGFVPFATTVKGIAVIPAGAPVFIVGARAAATTVHGLALLAVGSVDLSIGSRASLTVVHGISFVAGASLIPVPHCAATTTVHGVTFVVSGTALFIVGRVPLLTNVYGVDVHGIGGVAITLGRAPSITHVYGASVTGSGDMPIPVGTITALTIVYGLALFGAIVRQGTTHRLTASEIVARQISATVELGGMILGSEEELGSSMIGAAANPSGSLTGTKGDAGNVLASVEG